MDVTLHRLPYIKRSFFKILEPLAAGAVFAIGEQKAHPVKAAIRYLYYHFPFRSNHNNKCKGRINMQYRENPGNKDQLSILGYGCLRYSKKGTAIDQEKGRAGDGSGSGSRGQLF